jgi:hypothetical protein
MIRAPGHLFSTGIERRPHIILWPTIGKHPPEVFLKPLVLIHNGDARRASSPDTHLLYGIKTERG